MATQRRKRSKDQTTEVIERVRASSREAWLASLGALAKAQQDGVRNIENLFAEGRKLQARVRRAGVQAIDKVAAREEVRALVAQYEAMRKNANKRADRLQAGVANRVQDTLQMLGLPTRREFDAVAAKLDRLVAMLEAKGAPRARRTRRA